MKAFLEKIIRKVLPYRIRCGLLKARYELNLLSIDEQTERFIQHNRKVWGGRWVENCKSEILVDFYSVSSTLIAYSYFLNVLADRHDARIKTFSMGSAYSSPALYRVYQSFNTIGCVTPIFDQEQELRKRKICHDIKQNVKTKQDVFDIHVMGIWIGIDIYESYLRKLSRPAVYLNDPKLYDVIDSAVGLLVFWSEYFEKNKVAAVVVSHDAYVHLDILCKIAYQRKVPVYLPNIRGMSFVDSAHSLYSSRFKNYRKMFKSLSPDEQAEGLKLAKGQLTKRLSGEVGVNMPYSTKSAFKPFDPAKQVLKRSNKIKVLICSHCFFDNPHGYGGMLFVDFYEWLRFLGKISEKADYDWYLKTHPDPLPGTDEVIREIISEFPRITLLDRDTSFVQLAKEGLNFALTVYGTIGHELPLLGVQVITAGYNPHIAYDFNWHARTIEEYEYYLLNLDKLHKEINMQDLYEFYYVHYYYTVADDLFLKSYRQSTEDLDWEQQIGPATYEYFLNQLTAAKHRESIANVQRFIDSGKHNYFSRGPE